ncbi:MAG: glycosyltransferase [Clostridiales bacterium]|nr:glycosyltransferase [Clostridiales bacterium]
MAESSSQEQLIWASIVLYNPDLDMLARNLAAVSDQVDAVVVVDNGSKDEPALRKFFQDQGRDKIHVIWNGENQGIAAALNAALKKASEHHVNWLLTLDQDSVIPHEMIRRYKDYLDLPKVGQLCCVFFDPKYPDYPLSDMVPLGSPDYESEYAECSGCITSGCLMNVPIAMKIGGFDARLFIDSVDYDYSFRLRGANYKIYRINSVKMEHHLGNGKKKHFLFLSYMDYRYSPQRSFYQSRNAVYMIRTYKQYTSIFRKTLIHGMMTSLLGGRFSAFGACLKGIRAGRKMEVGHYAG